MLNATDRATWNQCPTCKSNNINGNGIEFAFDMLYQDLNCDNCLTTWVEVYVASHREDIQTFE